MQLRGDCESVERLAWVADGEIGDDYVYPLAGTPCEMVYRQAAKRDPHWFVETGLARTFPGDTALDRLGADSYRGEIFFDAAGTVVGHVFVMNDRPGIDNQETRSFFRLLSQRIGSEFHRWRAESALQISEEKYRRIIENAAGGIYRANPDGTLVEANMALARIHGCDSPSDLLRHFPKSTDVFVNHDDRDALISRLRRDGQVKNFEHAVRRKDGSVAWVTASGTSVHDADGTLLGYEGFVSDITDMKRAEHQLFQAQKMEAVGQLAGGIAHDFNNLLGIIIGNLELVVDNIENAPLAERYANTAAKAADRGATLSQRLLAFSRKQPAHPRDIDLKQMTLGIQDLLQRTLGEAIDIRLTSDPDLWPCLADPSQLESALINLAINARDAMTEGGTLAIAASNVELGTAEVATLGAVNPGDYVRLTVTDTGEGMPAEVLEHAFEPFYTTKDSGRGSGLGLSMVYGFARQSGGHVNIRSQVDKGTTVEILLPRHRGAATAAKAAQSDDGLPLARGETILLVEDDVDLRTLVVNIVKSLGYEVLEAGSGASAIEQLESAPYVSLLLTDLVLPGGIGGGELAEEVEQRRPGLPVLFMSGYTQDSIIHHGRLKAGFQLLQKPFRKSDIAQAIRDALDKGW